MHILVTGGAGFIGSFLCERLVQEGYAVRVLDNLDEQAHPDQTVPGFSEQVDFIQGDVRDRATCRRALEGVDAIVHAAAAVGVAQSLYRVEHFVDVNVRGTAALFQCLLEHRPRVKKIIVLTSMTGYGEGLYRRTSDGMLVRPDIRTEADIGRCGWEPVCPDTGGPLEAVPTPESARLRAQNVYALTKRNQEELAFSLRAAFDLPVVCLRLFNVYGPRQSLKNPYTGVLAIFLSRLREGKPPVVYEDGNQSRDFISVHDVVDAILASLHTREADGQIINIGSGMGIPIGEAARTLADRMNRSELSPEITGAYRRGDIRHCIADTHRARALLNFHPKVTWDQGLTELIAWATGSDSWDGVDRANQELQDWGLITDARAKGGNETAQ